MIQFITASHNNEIFKNNLGRSVAFLEAPHIVQTGFTNIPKAYNQSQAAENIICYIHHDVFLPESFKKDLSKSLLRLPPDWGVLGVAGVKLVNNKKQNIGFISDRGNKWGSPWNLPAEVQTLDELLLITKGDLKFDENLDTDFYGADICMQANLQGRKCFAINAYCEHNSTRPVGGRTKNFYKCEKYFRQKYINHLPIVTTCSLLT